MLLPLSQIAAQNKNFFSTNRWLNRNTICLRIPKLGIRMVEKLFYSKWLINICTIFGQTFITFTIWDQIPLFEKNNK